MAKNILMEHNLPFYEAFCQEIATYRKALYVAGTGLGKSYIIGQYLLDTNAKALIVVPTNQLRKQWEELAEQYNFNVELTTYQSLKNIKTCDHYDVIVVDEAHHVGASIWGSHLRRLVKESNCILIGTTATAERYSDSVQTANVFWDGRYVTGYSIAEAVAQGILPTFHYVVGLFEITDLVKEYKDRAKGITRNKEFVDTAIQSIELNFENQYNVSQIMAKHMPSGKCKGYVFVDRIASIPDAENFIKKALNIQTFVLHSKQRKAAQIANMEAFQAAQEGFIISVDMLGEGVRYDGTNVLIMFRRTLSQTIFTQQLGRVLSSHQADQEDIVVFDLVANIKNVTSRDFFVFDDDFMESEPQTVEERENTSRIQTKKQIVVSDYVSPLQETLDQIDEYLSRAWVQEEDQFLHDHYSTQGGEYCAKHLGRSVRACHARANRLGLKRIFQWTEEKDQFLCDNYPEHGSKYCAEHLCIDKLSCTNRAHVLGIKTIHHKWTKEQNQFLRDNYSRYGCKYCAVHVNHTEIACCARAKKLGLKFSGNNRWTETDNQFLRENYKKHGAAYCAKYLNHTEFSCRTRANKLGLKRNSRDKWTNEEAQFLRDNYLEHGPKYCAKYLDRTPSACQTKASQLRLNGGETDKAFISWTEEEDQFLQDNYLQHGVKYCAKHLGRTYGACKYQVQKLNLRRSVRWNGKEDQFLRDNYSKYGCKYCAEYLGRSVGSCKSRAARLDLRLVDLWTKDEDQIILDNYPIYGAKYCAEKLHRTINSCKGRASKLSVRLTDLWTEETVQFLCDNYPLYGTKYCAEHLGFTTHACQGRVQKLGLKKKKVSEISSQFLHENYLEHGATYCANALGISVAACRYRAKMLGLKASDSKWTEEGLQFLRDNYSQHGLKYCAKILKRTTQACLYQVKNLGLRQKKLSDKERDQFLRENYYEYGGRYCANHLGCNVETCRKWAKDLGLKYENEGKGKGK